jgi:hypothetical protein
MTDWNTVWSFLESFLIGLVIGTILGVGVASIVQLLRDKSDEKKRRKQTAGVLGYEIASIKLLSKQSRLANAQAIRTVKNEVKKCKDGAARKEGTSSAKITPTKIGDVDLPRAVYDRPTIDLSVFTPELAATISELYRWLDFSNHVKQEANEKATRLTNLMTSRGGRLSSAQDLQDAIFLQESFVSVAEGYMNDLKRITSLADAALTMINEIMAIDENRVQGDLFPKLSPPGGASK